MASNIGNLVDEIAWKKLVTYYASNKDNLDIRSMFQDDEKRFQKYR